MSEVLKRRMRCAVYTRKSTDEGLEKEVLASVPMRRFTTAGEVAEAIAFLADEERAAYVNGACLPVDGGHWLTGTNLGFLSAVERGVPLRK